MSEISPFYPFANAAFDCYGFCLPSVTYEPLLTESSTPPHKIEASIKVEESVPKRQKNASKLLIKMKRLIKQLHRQDVLNRKTHWSNEEDVLLRKLVQQEKLEWKLIPKYFQDRTQNMCYSRYRRLQLQRKEKKWTRDEEEKLSTLVQKYGEKWKRISEQLANFTPKQIRERYLNYLRPNIDRSDFSVQEDLKICKFVLEFGKHWRRLEEQLPGRPEGTIKSRFYAKLQRLIQSAYEDDE